MTLPAYRQCDAITYRGQRCCLSGLNPASPRNDDRAFCSIHNRKANYPGAPWVHQPTVQDNPEYLRQPVLIGFDSGSGQVAFLTTDEFRELFGADETDRMIRRYQGFDDL